MDFYDQHLLSALNKDIKPYGYKFKVKHVEGYLSLLFFNGTEWEVYADGYASDEMQELLFNASIFVFNRIISDIKDNH